MKVTLYGLLALLALSSCSGLKKTTSSAHSEPHLEHELLENGTAVEEKSRPASSRVDQALDDFYQEWEGTPHRMGGMSKQGVDCSGLVIIAYREVYQRQLKARRATDIYREMEPVDRQNLVKGDLVFFKIKGPGIGHVGLYVGDDRFMHASASRGVMISSLNEHYYRQRFYRGGRFKGAPK